jgi:CHAT domain-containing protein/tetratricopeptide (TPR) repeat protein
MPRPPVCVWLSLLASLVSVAFAPAAAPPSRLLLEREQDRVVSRLLFDVRTLREKGEVKEALTTATLLACSLHDRPRQVSKFGEALELLAELHIDQEEWTEAASVLDEAAALYRKHGEDDWRMRNVRLARERIVRIQRLAKEQRQKLVEASRKEIQAMRQRWQGQALAGIESARTVVAIRKEVLGEKDAEVARAWTLLAQLLQARAEYSEARRLFEQARIEQKAIFGEKHPVYANTLNCLALLDEETGDFARARTLFEQARDIRKEALGEAHPAYAQSLNDLGMLLLDRGEFTAAEPLLKQAVQIGSDVFGENHALYAASLGNLALLAQRRGHPAKARPLLEKALTIDAQALGEHHPTYAAHLGNLAMLYRQTGEYARARPMLERSLQLRGDALGEKHPEYAVGLKNLAALCVATGDYAQARSLLERAAALQKTALGEKHPLYATTLSILAGIYRETGRPGRSKQTFEQALAIRKATLGEKHPAYAATLSDLALLHRSLAEPEKAKPLLEEARAILRATVGEKHPLYATCLGNLGCIDEDLGTPGAARPLFEQALQIRTKKFGSSHPDTATAMQHLAHVLRTLGNRDQAISLSEQALQIRKTTLGAKHPDYAQSLLSLAVLLRLRGENGRALELSEQASRIYEAALGEKHPRFAASLHLRAVLHYALGEPQKAWPLSVRAIELSREQLRLAASAQDELGQLAASAHLRSRLDLLLSLPAPDNAVSVLYQSVLDWKAAVFVRQRLRRQYQTTAGAHDPETTRLVGELQDVCQQLAAFSFSSTEDGELTPARRAEMDRLSREKERLELTLARRSRTFERAHQAQRLTPALLQKPLPATVALVDFLEYTHVQPGGSPQKRMTVFVVRHDRLVRLGLGPAQPIADDVAAWRNSIDRRTQPCSGADDPAGRLRDSLWLPLREHIKGAKVVLLSPDGALSRLPFAALPGSSDDKYLLEEDVSLVVFPVPHLLPELAETPAHREKPSLLVVGDVNYDLSGVAGTDEDGDMRSRKGSPSGPWKELKATLPEMLTVRRSFQKRFGTARLTELSEGEATVAAVRGKLTGVSFAHLATHGFFSPAKVRSALAEGPTTEESDDRSGPLGWQPGLLSGLVLAGANKPAREGGGILTALEVSELDLRSLDLAVLSACDTGLGPVAGGEGVLGLQRAFQMAGARTTVTSLWEVNDNATQQLMQRFYEGLWNRTKPLTRVDALVAAQRLLLKDASVRSMARSDEKEDAPRRVPPRYWAGFVLAGDWR